MADEIETSAPEYASRAASVATSIFAVAIIVGVAGQSAVGGSVMFAMLAGSSFAVLAVIVFAHQR
jgi:hypothetical protein